MRPGELEYLSKYIQKKYPMYYNLDGFLGFVGDIGTDKKFRSEIELRRGDKSVVEFLNSGDMDSIIDELVDTYAQRKYTKIWANLDALSSRIKNVISKAAQKDYDIEIINDDILEKICQEIALGIIRNAQDDDYTIYLNGSFDSKYIEDYGYYSREYKKTVFNHVKDIVERKLKSCEFRVTEDTYLLMLSEITDRVISDYKYNDIINGVCDREILSMFSFYRKQLREEIIKSVDRCINEEVDYLIGISVNDVYNDILSLTIVKGEISAAKVIDGKLNNLIKSCVERNRKKIPDKTEAIKHIYNILFGEVMMPLSNEELAKLSEKIYIELRSNNLFDQDIVSGSYDDKIRMLYERELGINNSVENNKHPKRRKANWKKKKIHSRIISLILAGVITVSAGKLAIDGIEYMINLGSGIAQDISNRKPLKAVDDFDNYDYNYIFTKYTDSYERTLLNVLDFYNKTSLWDEEYKFLGFYRMYNNVMDDKLAIMDSALVRLKAYSSNRAEYRDFYVSISGYTCYLDFVSDRLFSMGCQEIKDSKYQDAISKYRAVMEFVRGSEVTPMDYLIAKHPKEASIIEEIMKLYNEYSHECQVEFGQKLIDGKIESNEVGRKI